jgi:aminoglycoside/choline kinase family phosphotransferase
MVSDIITSRDEQLDYFLRECFSKKPEVIEPIVGDAGLRSYYRIVNNNVSYIVMDCPSNYCSVKPFIDIANYLRDKGFSAPEIIGRDVDQGFLVIEDFGIVSIKDYLLGNNESDSSRRKKVYQLIIDLLVSLQAQEIPKNLQEFDITLLCSELEVFVDWYIPYAYKRELTIQEFEEFVKIWQNILLMQTPMLNSIVLRDYHVENMMYLEREGVNKLGLLDFQDALYGSPVYDLVSVLEDARIEVSREEALGYIEYFAARKEMEMDSVLLNYHILGAQRNSRILGVFARKANRDNDKSYLQYIPRVLKYLEYDLSHSTLEPLKTWFSKLR